MQSHVSFGVTLRVLPFSLAAVMYLLHLYILCLVRHSLLMHSSWTSAVPGKLAIMDWRCNGFVHQEFSIEKPTAWQAGMLHLWPELEALSL